MDLRNCIFLFIIWIILLTVGCGKERGTTTNFDQPPSTRTTTDLLEVDFEDIPLVLLGNEGEKMMVAYRRTTSDGKVLSFTSLQNQFPEVMIDNEGNKWSVFGEAVEGPRKGEFLTRPKSYMGYFFAFGAMYPGVDIYGEGGIEVSPNYTTSEEWTIPTGNLFAVTGADAIQAIDEPVIKNYNLKNVQFATDFFIEDDDLIVGVEVKGQSRAYPISILNWHEIINDELGEVPISVIYCPLTGTTTIWPRSISTGVTTFGVSGMLFNNNIVPYDRATGSRWTQLYGECANGPLRGEEIASLRFVETTWKEWRDNHINPEFVSDETGSGFDYTTHPYLDYPTDQRAIFYSLDYKDERLPAKERVMCVVVNGEAIVFQFKDLK